MFQKMNRVDNILIKAFSTLKHEEKLQVKRLRPYQPRDVHINQKDGKKNRTFCKSWFEKKKWLTVSDNKNALFCFYCLLFGGENVWARTGCNDLKPVSYTHLRAHETPEHLVCRLLLEKK